MRRLKVIEMAWETRERGGRYYTRSKRVNGRVRREYVGTGALAEAIADLDGYDRLRRVAAQDATRAAFDELDELEAAVSEYDAAVTRILTLTLEAAGYHRHDRGEWRRKKDRTMTPKTADAAPQELAIPDTREARLAAISAGVNAPEGSPAEALAIECIRQIHKEDAPPSYDTFSGSLLDMTAPKSQTIARLIMKLGFDRDCSNLAGPNATMLEKLLAERVVVCRGHLAQAEQQLGTKVQEGVTVPVALLFEKRINVIHRRYIASMKALAQVRKLQRPSIQVNVGQKQVNIGEKQMNVTQAAGKDTE
jgi:hypothetical protein